MAERSSPRKGARPGTSPPDGRRSPGGRSNATRSPQGSVVSGGSNGGGSYTSRDPRSPKTPGSQGSDGRQRNRPKSADGSYRGSYGGASYRGDGGSPNDGMQNPIHNIPRDRNQYAMNSPQHMGGRLPNGRLLSGSAPEGMLHHPRCGTSRTQFGGIWEDHKTPAVTGDRPAQSNTRTGFSEFGDNEDTEKSTHQHHFGTFFDGSDTMSHVKPNKRGMATVMRGVNGYGRNATGGFCTREQMGELPRYKHADSWRGMPAWARKIPEPTRPGPGYTRTDQGGYFRT